MTCTICGRSASACSQPKYNSRRSANAVCHCCVSRSDLVFVWSKLHSRLKTSKQALLEESRQLMLSATNVNSIFPFIRVILQEVRSFCLVFVL